jgi:hypothetical protein
MTFAILVSFAFFAPIAAMSIANVASLRAAA